MRRIAVKEELDREAAARERESPRAARLNSILFRHQWLVHQCGMPAGPGYSRGLACEAAEPADDSGCDFCTVLRRLTPGQQRIYKDRVCPGHKARKLRHALNPFFEIIRFMPWNA